MRTVYVDSENKCHVNNDGTMTPVKTNFFDGKCDCFVEGFCFESTENESGAYSWRPFEQLEAAQTQYEIDMAEAAAAYQEGVDSAYDQ